MGFLSNKIRVEDLKPGDHVYTWRGLIYAHHGIYVGDGYIVHFRGEQEEKDAEELHVVDKMLKNVKHKVFKTSVGSNSNSNSRWSKKCEKCSINEKPNGVSKCCVRCFVDGGHMYRCKYDAGPILPQLKRAGTCTAEKASEVKMILHRAEYLLSSESGFGEYDLFNRNCEDFALYCTLGVVGIGQGVSGQVARFNKTMPRVKEITVEDLVTEMQPHTTQPPASTTHQYWLS